MRVPHRIALHRADRFRRNPVNKVSLAGGVACRRQTHPGRDKRASGEWGRPMAESRTSGGGSQSTPSVRPESANLSTHESDPGDGGTPSATSIDALKRGHTLGRYLVIEQVGAGAMGV